MSKNIKELKRQIAALEKRVEELEGGDKRDYYGELYDAIAKATGCSLEEFEDEVEDDIGDMIFSKLPNILFPEIASYIAGFHVGVSLCDGTITGVADGVNFYERYSHHFEQVGFENFQLGFEIPYNQNYRHLSFDVLLEKFIETPLSHNQELRGVIAMLKRYAEPNGKTPTEEEALEIIGRYIYYVESDILEKG
jgi:hypothetical protein